MKIAHNVAAHARRRRRQHKAKNIESGSGGEAYQSVGAKAKAYVWRRNGHHGAAASA